MPTRRESAYAVWAVLLYITAAAQAQECPNFKDIIEELPVRDLEGNTCNVKDSSISRYESGTCRIPGEDYPGGEAVYKVRLNEGNEVSFSLDVQGSADLVLALVETCGDGTSCFSSSPDFIGSGDEGISATTYPSGIYYLYVDSVAGACGPYKLTVEGINPTPDLVLDLRAPQRAIAGAPMTYNLSITNRGTLDATEVKITQTLPEGMTLQPDSECPGNGRMVVCTIGKLKKGETVSKEVKVGVSSDTRGSRTSTAEATANEGSPALPARDEATTRVDGESDLSIRMTRSPDPVVAGRRLTYTFTLRNAGPSDATRVKVIDTLLSGKETFFQASADWACEAVTEDGISKVICEMPGIPTGDTVTRSISVDVKPSAFEPLVNKATVTALEKEPTCRKRKCGPNSAAIETPVERETDLTIDKAGPAEFAVGGDFSYTLTVVNKGPSDSSGAMVKDCLPKDLVYVERDSRCELSLRKDDVCVGDLVTCRIGPLDFGHQSSVTIGAKTAPDLSPTTLSNTASLEAKEKDPTGTDESKPVETRFRIEADLRLVEKKAVKVSDPEGDAQSVCVGENILYTIKTVNDGPSNSRGGTICDKFPEGLSFVSSPDGCTPAGPELSDLCTVTCPVPPLVVHEPHSVRVVARPSEIGDEETTVTNQASVTSVDDPNPRGEIKSFSTTIRPVADLEVALSAFPDHVRPEEPLTYTLDVTNGGSGAKDLKVRLNLEKVSISPDPDCVVPPGCSVPGSCTLNLGDIPKGETRTLEVCVAAPSTRGNITAHASLVAPDSCDPTENNTANTTTTVAAEGDVDLALTMKANAETVVAGDLLSYTIQVDNQGPAASPPITVTDELPEGAELVSVLPLPPACDPDARPVNCPNLAAPYPTVEVTVKVLPGANAPFKNTATVKADSNDPAITPPPDPDPTDNEASIETPVLPGPLLLPFFEVGGGPEAITSLFALRNLSPDPINVRYDFFVTSPEAKKITLTPPLLAVQATDTVNLRDVAGLAGKIGYVAISPDPPDAPRAPLGGDFVRIDPSRGTASGELLVSTDTSRMPPELCRSWSVRFLNGEPLEASTEFLFFIPGNGSSTSQEVVTGGVYNEKGQFVQKISVDTAEEAFRRTSQDKFNNDLPLLARSGSIEWTLRDELVGHVIAVHREKGKDEVAVPGFCRVPRSENEPSTLILPFFEVDPRDPAGLTTVFAVRNETENIVQVQSSYFSSDGNPAGESSFSLAGRETRTVNLRHQELGGMTKGYVRVELDPPADASRTLSGDFVRFDPLRGLAGSALVDASPRRSPRQLCRHWDVRFVQDAPLGRISGFVFYRHDGPSWAPKGMAYGEGGGTPQEVEVPTPLLPSVSFLLPASTLHLSGSGSVEWDLGENVLGNVAAILTEGQSSVLVPGICRDASP